MISGGIKRLQRYAGSLKIISTKSSSSDKIYNKMFKQFILSGFVPGCMLHYFLKNCDIADKFQDGVSYKMCLP